MPVPTDASLHRGIAVLSKTAGGGWHVCLVKGQDGRGAASATLSNNVELAADEKDRLTDLLDRRYVCYLDSRLTKDVPELAEVRPVDPHVLIGAALAEQSRVALAAADRRRLGESGAGAAGAVPELAFAPAPPLEEMRSRTGAFDLAQVLVSAWNFWLDTAAARTRRTGEGSGDEDARDLPDAFRERYDVLVLPAGEIAAPPGEDETVDEAVPDGDAPAPVGDDASGGDERG